MIVRYHSSARQEIVDITRYYARMRRDLGEKFGAALDAAISIVTSDPLRFEQVCPGIRRILLKRFPYGVYYRVPDADTIYIIVVKHHHRRPGLGMRRR